MEYILIIEIKFVASDEKLSGINGNHKTKNIQVNSRIKNSLNDIYTFFYTNRLFWYWKRNKKPQSKEIKNFKIVWVMIIKSNDNWVSLLKIWKYSIFLENIKFEGICLVHKKIDNPQKIDLS